MGQAGFRRQLSSYELLPLLIPTISLTRFYFRFRFLSHILAQRATLIIRFVELSFTVATNIAFVSAGIDQLALTSFSLLWHFTLLDFV